MAMLLRKQSNGYFIALCAAKHKKLKGDIYLTDGMHQAIADKIAKDWKGQLVDW